MCTFLEAIKYFHGYSRECVRNCYPGVQLLFKCLSVSYKVESLQINRAEGQEYLNSAEFMFWGSRHKLTLREWPFNTSLYSSPIRFQALQTCQALWEVRNSLSVLVGTRVHASPRTYTHLTKFPPCDRYFLIIFFSFHSLT